MSENHENRYQLRAAAKAFEWLRRSKPAVAAREQEKMSEGISLPPNERDCGTACSMQGTDRETLNEWCKEHETSKRDAKASLLRLSRNYSFLNTFRNIHSISTDFNILIWS